MVLQKSLARELAELGDHRLEDVEFALSAFIDPANPDMVVEEFFKHLTKLALGDQNTLSAHESTILNGLLSVLNDVKKARLFNETYIGHMLSESSIPGMLGYMLALRIGSNTVAREVSLLESGLEKEAIDHLLRIVGYQPGEGSGTFTSGGTLAMMTALAVARKSMQEEYEKLGKPLGKLVVVASPFAHYSIPKVCDLLGGPNKDIEFIRVEPTPTFKISMIDLKNKVAAIRSADDKKHILAIIAIAGETETGLVDPLSEIADFADANSVRWIADGAYGAPYILSRVSESFRGIERAFAITLDPHKALYTPYSNGCVLFKNMKEHVKLAYNIEGEYVGFVSDPDKLFAQMQKGEETLGEKRIEGSMSAGPILSTVAVLRTLRTAGLTTIYNLTLDRIKYLHDRLKRSEYLWPLHKPELNLLCFTLNSSTIKKLGILDNDQLLEFINVSRKVLDKDFLGKGGYFFSRANLPISLVDSVGVWRACVMHPRTTNQIIDDAITALEEEISKAIREKTSRKPH